MGEVWGRCEEAFGFKEKVSKTDGWALSEDLLAGQWLHLSKSLNGCKGNGNVTERRVVSLKGLKPPPT